MKVYGDRDPLEPGFRLFDQPGEIEPPSFDAIARQVFVPIHEHLEQESA